MGLERGSAVTDPTESFVTLLDEHVDLRRSVHAEYLHYNVSRIADQPYDRDVETWQFEPGDEVVCELVESNDGEILVESNDGEILPATHRADRA
jgi:hypothetical protein